MKKTKTTLLLTLAGTATFTIGLWLYSTMDSLGLFEIGTAIAVYILVIFSIIIGLKKMKEQKKGFAVEDELSDRIKQKAAANAFAYSFYLWVMIILFTIDTSLRIEVPIGIGILGMGLLFIGFWIYYSKGGIQDEN